MNDQYTKDFLQSALNLLPGTGRWLNGRCPVAEHKDTNPSFGVLLHEDGTDFSVKCHVCDDQKLVYKAAMEQIQKFISDPEENKSQSITPGVKLVQEYQGEPTVNANQKYALQIYDKANGNDTEICADYLRDRGLIGNVPDGFRQHILKCDESQYPTMIAPVVDSEGALTAIHRTFLSELDDGSVVKADVAAPKKALGPIKGFSVHIGEPDAETLHIAEGIETAIAINEALKVAVWATLSAKNLIDLKIPDDIRTVFIWADNDESVTGMRCAAKRADILVAKGCKTYLILPEAKIPDGKKGIDWLDMGNEAVMDAFDNAVEHKQSCPWSHVKMPTDAYSMSEKGVFKEKLYANGEIGRDLVATGPIYFSGKRIEVASGQTDLQLSWAASDEKKVVRKWLSRGQVLKRNSLMDLAELNGFPIYDGISGRTVEFLALCERENRLPIDYVTRKPGFVVTPEGERFFVLREYDEKILFHPEPEYEPYGNALGSGGCFDAWVDVFNKIVDQSPIVLFSVLAALCGPILELLKLPNFGVDFWGKTSIGKTSLLRLIASVWGKAVGSDGLILGWNNSPAFCNRIAAFYGNGLIVIFDDSQTAKDQAIEYVTYLVANGRSKGLAAPYSIKETEFFRLVLFSTGEKPITENSFPGAQARIIEIHGSPFPSIDRELLHEARQKWQENYGFLGRYFVDELLKQGLGELKEAYLTYLKEFQLLAENELGNRFAEYFAAVRLAGKIAEILPAMEWIKPLIDDSLKAVWDKSTEELVEVDMAQSAAEGIAAWIASNGQHFEISKVRELREPIMGRVFERDGYVALIPQQFDKALRECNIPSQKAVIAEWKDRGWLEYSGGRNQKQVLVNKKQVRCICVKLSALFPGQNFEALKVNIESLDKGD